MKFKQFIEYNKEGMIIGGLIGIGLYLLNPSFMFKLNLPDLWWHKLTILILLSSTIGAIVDYLYKPRK